MSEDIEDPNGHVDEKVDEISTLLNNYTTKKKEKLLGDINELDEHLRVALSMVLSYWADHNQFNQDLLEDVSELIKSRHYLLNKVKG